MIMTIAINNIDYNDEFNGCKHTKIMCALRLNKRI